MRKQRFIFAIIGLLLVLIIAACGGTAEESGEPSATPGEVNVQEEALPVSDEEENNDPAAQEAVVSGQDGQDVYESLATGFNEEGFPYRGDPAAPVVLEEFSDYLCPFCGRHFNETLPTLIENYIAEGKVQYVFRDMPLVSLHPNAPIGHKAAICAGQQGADLYWTMHDELFAQQNTWGSVPEPVVYVTSLAESAGVDMGAFETCMASTEIDTEISQRVAFGQSLGFTGTPSFRFTSSDSSESYTLIGAYPLATFSQWIDALLAGEEPPQDEQQAEAEPPELPFWANEDGLAPDPDNPGVNMAGDQYKGNPEASVVVIEFSDFQCPACQQHALGSQPAVDEALVETGQVMWVHKHLPLQIHPQALVAATASECAADQGMFWEMHDLLFETVDQWAVEEAETELVGLAVELQLDEDEFAACLASREPVERIVADIYASMGAVSSTPSFIVLKDGRGSVLQGSRPAEDFVTLLEGVLEEGGN